MGKLIIIRGVPGSGKSTKAKALMFQNPKLLHYEADMFFHNDKGEYVFDPSKLREAHAWCQKKVQEALERNFDVIVSNTSVRKWEVQVYVDIARKAGVPYEILTMRGEFKNIHGCPDSKVTEMRNRFEEIPDTFQDPLLGPTVSNKLTCEKCGTKMIGYDGGHPDDKICSDCAYPKWASIAKRAAEHVEKLHFDRTGEKLTFGEILRKAL